MAFFFFWCSFCYWMARYLLYVLLIKVELTRKDFLKLTTLSPFFSSFYLGKAQEHFNMSKCMKQKVVVSNDSVLDDQKNKMS